MTRTEISLHAYDVMDSIQITIRCKQSWAPDDESGEWITLLNERMSGSGIVDPTDWVRDVLIACMESL